MKRTGRKILLWLVTALAFLLLVAIAMPLWFPWLLGPVGRKAGLHFQRYQREGYSRFELGSVSFTNADVQVTAGRMRFFVPTIWAWHHFRSHKTLTYGEAIDWKVTIISAQPEKRGPEAGTYRNAQKIASVVHEIDHWVPGILLSNGSVRVSGRGIQVQRFVWQNGSFHGVVKADRLQSGINVDGRAGGAAWELHAGYAPLALEANLRATMWPSNLVLTGSALLGTNRFDLNAEFARTSSLPQKASLTCNEFAIPGRLVQLKNYGTVTGALSLLWQRESFAAEVRANGAPMADSKVPPIDVRLNARGDLEHVEIGECKIVIPGIQAELANSITLPIT